MSRPGIEPVTSRSPEQTLYLLSYRGGRTPMTSRETLSYACAESHSYTIIRPVAGQGSSPETRCPFLKHFRILYPFIPNTIQINQRLCNNWHCKDLTKKKSVSLILRWCTGIGTVLRKMFRLGSIVMNKIHWRLRKKTEIVKHLSQNFYIKILSLWPSGLGKVRYKILDQFLSPCQTWINPIKGFTKTDIVKTKNKRQYKNSKSVTLTLKSCTGLGIILHKILDQRLSSYQTWNKYTTGFGNNGVLKT